MKRSSFFSDMAVALLVGDGLADCVFRVLPQRQYHAQKEINKLLRKYGLKDFSQAADMGLEPHVWSKLVAAQEKLDAENRENETEKRRALGTLITYGQTVQVCSTGAPPQRL